MKKKISNMVAFIGTKNLIAIVALLVLVIAISVGIAVSNSKSDKKADNEIEENTGLQVEENADGLEGDSIDFGEFQTEEEKKNDSDNKQEGNDKTQSDNNEQSGSGSGNGGLIDGSEDDKKDNTISGSEFGQLF